MDDKHLLAHEIQAPLTSLGLQLSALIELDPENEILERCLQEVEELQTLVRNFLDLGAKVERGPVPLQPLFERLERRFQPIAETKRVGLRIEHAEKSVLGDAWATERILSNLIDNAIKFSKEDGCVSLRTSQRNGNVEIEVCDDGAGIPPDLQERIFDPFCRIDREGPGAGLGLALVRRLAEAQNGSVRVDSTPGRGSSFFLILPSSA